MFWGISLIYKYKIVRKRYSKKLIHEIFWLSRDFAMTENLLIFSPILTEIDLEARKNRREIELFLVATKVNFRKLFDDWTKF